MKTYTGQMISTFQERFSTLCEENPGSLTKLAESLHVSKQTVSAWKNGTRSPRRPTIVAIADYFGITVSWLMGFDVEKIDKEGKKARSIVLYDSDLFRKLMENITPEDYETILAIFSKTEKKMRKEGKL